MKLNESGFDRIIRVVLAIILFVLYFSGVVTGGLGIILLILGAIMLITAAIGFCPIYALIKFRTNKS